MRQRPEPNIVLLSPQLPFYINIRGHFPGDLLPFQNKRVPAMSFDLIVSSCPVSLKLFVMHKGLATEARLGVDVRDLVTRFIDTELVIIRHQSRDQFRKIGS